MGGSPGQLRLVMSALLVRLVEVLIVHNVRKGTTVM